MSPTQRSLALARELGLQVQVVERWNMHSRTRLDLFDAIDLVACSPAVGILGIQACASASHAARRTKAAESPKIRVWLESGARFEVWSWGKMGARGKRKVWTVRREELVVRDGVVDVRFATEGGVSK